MRSAVAFDFDAVNFARASVAFWGFHNDESIRFYIIKRILEFFRIRAVDDNRIIAEAAEELQ